jgi:hypothetical protein
LPRHAHDGDGGLGAEGIAGCRGLLASGEGMRRRFIAGWLTREGYLSLLEFLGRVGEDVFFEDDVALAVSLCWDVESLDDDLELGEAAKFRGCHGRDAMPALTMPKNKEKK